MVLMVFGNVVLRYGFNSGITVGGALRWLFVWMTFLGAIVAVRHAHLGTDALVARLPGGQRPASWPRTSSCCSCAGSCSRLLATGGDQLRNHQRRHAGFDGVAVRERSDFRSARRADHRHELWKLVTGRLDDAQLVGVVESDDMPYESAVTIAIFLGALLGRWHWRAHRFASSSAAP
jgi:hypothetical protein